MRKAQTVQTATKLKRIASAVEDIEDNYSYICLNPYLSCDRKIRFDEVSLLRKEGLSVMACLYQYSCGNAVGNFYFIWKIGEGDGDDMKMTHSNRLTATIKKEIPIYHTRQMRREFSMKFGSVANAKPVYLREIYRQLTHDASAPINIATSEIDERAKLLLEMQDADIVVDLRDHNPG